MTESKSDWQEKLVAPAKRIDDKEVSASSKEKLTSLTLESTPIRRSSSIAEDKFISSTGNHVRSSKDISDSLPGEKGINNGSNIAAGKVTSHSVESIQDEKVDAEFEELLRKPNTGEISVSSDPIALKVLSGFKM